MSNSLENFTHIYLLFGCNIYDETKRETITDHRVVVISSYVYIQIKHYPIPVSNTHKHPQ